MTVLIIHSSSSSHQLTTAYSCFLSPFLSMQLNSGDKGKDKKFYGPTILPPPSSSSDSSFSPDSAKPDYPPYKDSSENGRPSTGFFPTVDGKLPPKVAQVKPNKSKYHKDPYGSGSLDHGGKNTVDQKLSGVRPSLVDINNQKHPNLPHGMPPQHPNHPGDDDIGHPFVDEDEQTNENNAPNNNSNEEYPSGGGGVGVRPPNYPGPGFFNPSASKNQFQDLNSYQHPGQQEPQQRPGGGQRPGVFGNNNNHPQVVDKNLPPNELYQILTGQAVPGGHPQQQLTFEQILQHIQAIDGQGVPPQQQQRPTNTNQPQHPHLPPFLTGHLNQNNVNYPPPPFAGKLPPGWWRGAGELKDWNLIVDLRLFCRSWEQCPSGSLVRCSTPGSLASAHARGNRLAHRPRDLRGPRGVCWTAWAR